jgi:hypothetical protein
VSGQVTTRLGRRDERVLGAPSLTSSAGTQSVATDDRVPRFAPACGPPTDNGAPSRYLPETTSPGGFMSVDRRTVDLSGYPT